MKRTWTRRRFLIASGVSSITLAFTYPSRTVAARRLSTGGLRLYIGTYTKDGRGGIHAGTVDPETGAITITSVVDDIVNPSFLAASHSGRYLYAVSETEDTNGTPGGSVHSFRIDPETGKLDPLNRQSSGGGSPCHLVVDRWDRFVLVANYSGGNVALLPIGDDGSLDPASDVKQHAGSSVNEKRQRGPHAHSITLDGANRYAVAADLGIDKLMVYRFDARRRKLTPGDPPFIATRPGAGPRHLAFHPGGLYAYLVNELDSTVTAFRFDAAKGRLTHLQTIATVAAGAPEPNYPADIHVAPSGTCVYASNRGDDSIVAFSVDEKTGMLTPLQRQPTLGKWPRNFAIDPGGRLLLVANQRSDAITAFSVRPDTGLLTPTGGSAEIPMPACICFAPEPH